MSFISPIKARTLWFVAKGRELEDGRKRVYHAYETTLGRTMFDPPVTVLIDETLYITQHYTVDGLYHLEGITHGPRQAP